MQVNKANIKENFQRIDQHFKDTSHLLLLKVFILHHTKNAYF